MRTNKLESNAAGLCTANGDVKKAATALCKVSVVAFKLVSLSLLSAMLGECC